MKRNVATEIRSDAGFGIWKALLLIVFLALIVAAVMKAISILMAVVLFVLAVIVIGVIANVSDITRYMKISGM